jgi:hypothetical protein
MVLLINTVDAIVVLRFHILLHNVPSIYHQPLQFNPTKTILSTYQLKDRDIQTGLEKNLGIRFKAAELI